MPQQHTTHQSVYLDLLSLDFRTVGQGILPQQQHQVNLLPKMLTFLGERLSSEGRIFQIAGWPMLDYTYDELLTWYGDSLEPCCLNLCV